MSLYLSDLTKGTSSGFSGYSGISGYSGYSSTSGHSGFSGVSGYSGFSGSGVSGYSGFSGSGVSGYSGFSGISGYSGFSGISGYSGFSGISGYSGWSGISGYSGWSGISGFSGISGYSGYSGIAGPATAINATDDAATSSAIYPVMVGAAGSNQTPKVTTSKFTFTPSTGAFSVTGAGVFNSGGTDLALTIQGTSSPYAKFIGDTKNWIIQNLTGGVFRIQNQSDSLNTIAIQPTGSVGVAGGANVVQPLYVQYGGGAPGANESVALMVGNSGGIPYLGWNTLATSSSDTVNYGYTGQYAARIRKAGGTLTTSISSASGTVNNPITWVDVTAVTSSGLSVTGTLSSTKTLSATTGSDTARSLYIEGYPSGLETALFYRDNTDAQPVIVIRSDQATGSTYGTYLQVKDQANSIVGSVKASGVGTGDIIMDGATSSTLSAGSSPIARATSTGLAVTGQISTTSTLYASTSVSAEGTLTYNASSNKTIGLGAGNSTGVDNGRAYYWQQYVSGNATGQSWALQYIPRGGSATDAISISGSGTPDATFSAAIATVGSLTVMSAAPTKTSVQIGSSNGTTQGWYIGNYGNNGSGIWTTAVTPSTTNHSIYADSGTTTINAATNTYLDVGNSHVVTVTSTGLSVTGTGSFSSNLFTTGGSTPGVGTSGVNLWQTSNNVRVQQIDSSRSANGRVHTIDYTSGQILFRWLNDAQNDASQSWLTATGSFTGSGTGVTGITSNSGSGSWAHTGAFSVTGTLSSTDTISSTKNGALFTKTGGTVNAQWFQIQNNSNTYIGVENSAGGGIFTGSTAYAAVWGAASNYPAQIFSNNSLIGSFSSTGLAVTGTLSSTGIRTSAGNPAFEADVSTDQTNVTGDSTGYKVAFNNENYDVNSDYNNSTYTFTAPVTGKYLFSTSVSITNISSGHTTAILTLITSNRSYTLWRGACYASADGYGVLVLAGAASVDMDTSDTAYVQLAVYGSTKTITVQGSANSLFAGQLVN